MVFHDRILAVLFLLCFAVSAPAQDCTRPYPVNIPGEPPAEREAMLDLQKQVKAYLAEAEAYLACNEAEQQKLAPGLSDPERRDEAEVQIQVLLTRYNNTVDEMHAVGNRFNALVKAFNEPGG